MLPERYVEALRRTVPRVLMPVAALLTAAGVWGAIETYRSGRLDKYHALLRERAGETTARPARQRREAEAKAAGAVTSTTNPTPTTAATKQPSP